MSASTDAQPTTVTGRARSSGIDAETIVETVVETELDGVLADVSDHADFFRAVLRAVGHEEKADSHPVGLYKTAFYDFDKAVGGDGMSTGPINKRTANLIRDGTDRKVAATRIHLRDAETVGRFVALADAYDREIEWGFDKTPRGNDLTVWVAPSDAVDW